MGQEINRIPDEVPTHNEKQSRRRVESQNLIWPRSDDQTGFELIKAQEKEAAGCCWSMPSFITGHFLQRGTIPRYTSNSQRRPLPPFDCCILLTSFEIRTRM